MGTPQRPNGPPASSDGRPDFGFVGDEENTVSPGRTTGPSGPQTASPAGNSASIEALKRIEQLRNWGTPEARHELEQIAQRHPDGEVKKAAIQALQNLPKTPAIGNPLPRRQPQTSSIGGCVAVLLVFSLLAAVAATVVVAIDHHYLPNPWPNQALNISPEPLPNPKLGESPLSPDDTPLFQARAAINQGKFDNARSLLEQADRDSQTEKQKEIRKNLAEVYFHLAEEAASNNNNPLAVEYYCKALAFNPDNQQARARFAVLLQPKESNSNSIPLDMALRLKAQGLNKYGDYLMNHLDDDSSNKNMAMEVFEYVQKHMPDTPEAEYAKGKEDELDPPGGNELP